MAHEGIKRALNGKKKGATHTHGVHYERAANGGYIAHVHKHHGKGPHSEGHSHSEVHSLPDADAAQEHFEQHMGDQPPVGDEQMAQGQPAPAPPGGGGGDEAAMEQQGAPAGM